MNDRLIIIGAGGHGKVLADIALKMKRWSSIAFLDDDRELGEKMGIPVIGTLADIGNWMEDTEYVVGIGNNTVRERIHDCLEQLGANIVTLIHPSSVIGEQVELGAGTVVVAGAVINCCTRIGRGCIINTAATIDHDSSLEEFVHVSPGSHLGGAVKVGKGSWIGIGVAVSHNVIISPGCTIGAGAVVIKDIVEAGTYVGVPVRKTNKV
jgi:sugar O-acyltransferase (sialic acid O-acetyltransferase NeuD family)